jgi:hypothetical protein
VAQNRRKTAAVASTGVIAAGGAAHFTGVLDDVFHSGSETRSAVREPFHEPEGIPPERTPTPGDPPTVVPGAGEATATRALLKEGADDVAAKEIICFAYDNFVDNDGIFTATSEDAFLGAVVGELAPQGSALSYRIKASELYSTLSDPDTDWSEVASELVC